MRNVGGLLVIASLIGQACGKKSIDKSNHDAPKPINTIENECVANRLASLGDSSSEEALLTAGHEIFHDCQLNVEQLRQIIARH